MRQAGAPNVGDIYSADLPFMKHVQSGKRPVIIAQNDIGNLYSPIIHVIPLTKQMRRANTQPTHVTILADNNNRLKNDSVALVEDTVPVPIECLKARIGKIGEKDIPKLKKAFQIHFPFAAG